MARSSARVSHPAGAVADGDGEGVGLVLGAGKEVVVGRRVPVARSLGLGAGVMDGVADGRGGEGVGESAADASGDSALCDATAVPLGVPILASPARDDRSTAKTTARRTNWLDGER